MSMIKYKCKITLSTQSFALFLTSLDRFFLSVGSESGKASHSLATRVPGKGTEDIQARSGGVADQMAKNMEVRISFGLLILDIHATPRLKNQECGYIFGTCNFIIFEKAFAAFSCGVLFCIFKVAY